MQLPASSSLYTFLLFDLFIKCSFRASSHLCAVPLTEFFCIQSRDLHRVPEIKKPYLSRLKPEIGSSFGFKNQLFFGKILKLA